MQEQGRARGERKKKKGTKTTTMKMRWHHQRFVLVCGTVVAVAGVVEIEVGEEVVDELRLRQRWWLL